MSMSTTTTTTAQGVVTIETAVTDGDGARRGSLTTVFRTDATSGAATEGNQTMETAIWLDGSEEASPYTLQKALAAAAAAHFGEVADHLDDLTQSS